MDDQPAQKILVNKYLDWVLVKERLQKFPNIGSQFPENILRRGSVAPYYCHYLAWRLGTWRDDSLFFYFDELLKNGIGMKGWDGKESQLQNNDFGEYWGLIWELQLASYFRKIKQLETEWLKSGPDLKIVTEQGPMYVECYTYRKSFALEGYIGELLTMIDGSHLKAKHNLFMPLSLAQNNDRDQFLNTIFTPFLEPNFLSEKLREAETSYPVILGKYGISNGDNLIIYVEGDDADAYTPNDTIDSGIGDPETYLGVALDEAIRNKYDRNKLPHYHPNVLAINYLLSQDYQVALMLKPIHTISIDLGENLDAVFWAACGIDGRISDKSFGLKITDDKPHPITGINFGTNFTAHAQDFNSLSR